MSAPSKDLVEAVAALHCRTLPNSKISVLGPPFAKSLYRFARASDFETVFAAVRGDKELVGGALLSLDPEGLMRRALTKTSLVPRLILHPRFVLENVASHLRVAFRRNHSLARTLPEVIAIFTTDAQRNRGVGRELLRAVEATLRELGARRYMVRTEARDDNRALRFYCREGFTAFGTLFDGPVRFVLLAKEIADE